MTRQPQTHTTASNQPPAGAPMLMRPFGGPGMFGKDEKAKNTRGTLLRLWSYLRRHSLVLSGVVGLVALNTLIGVLGPYLMGQAIDVYIQHGDLIGLSRLLMLMLIAYVLNSIGTWLQ